jgi:hypothetical protein
VCGASQQEKNAAADSQTTTNLLVGNYIQNNGEQQQILKTIQDAMTPIVNAGAEQMGFAGPEGAALTTQAINNAAANTRDVEQVARAGSAGGAALTPAQLSAINNTAAASSAGTLAQTLNNNTIASAQTGANRFAGAVTGLNAVAAEQSPTGVAGNLLKAQSQTYNMDRANAQAGAQQFGEIAGGLAGLASSGAQLYQSYNNSQPGQTPSGGYGELQSVAYNGNGSIQPDSSSYTNLDYNALDNVGGE